MKVVITDSVFPNHDPEASALAGLAEIVVAPAGDHDRLIQLLGEADAVLNCYVKITPDMLTSMRRCRIIARYGIGVDTIPVAAARAAGIAVTNVPDYCVDEVADHSMALILSLLRKIHIGRTVTARGEWSFAPLKPLHRLRGRTLAVLGFGRIARALATRAQAHGIRVIAYDPYIDDEIIAEHGAQSVSLGQALKSADILSLHLPLTEATTNLVGASELGQMRRDAILINTARGGLLDLDATLVALEGGALGGVGLDVLPSEPPQSGLLKRISACANAIVTPHSGFYSEEAMVEMQLRAAMNVAAVLRGEPPVTPVNQHSG
ncbi:C-terminal binding protein [Mesorhizobium sp. NZP2298]|uniref:C-terminal binding protein n=1 Tax=Mesorhizobium sp. NZP2298 TaxID=2483403 RepID=UPI001557350B|nr:C-terminal binding protein [Mesorhizobium sp. NZP2298]